MTFEVPEFVRLKALDEGERGRAWLDGLGDMVAGLARDWDLTLGASMTGGTEAFVVEALTADGREAVLKIGVPGSDLGGGELRVLTAAGGRGYVEVFRHDQPRDAMLLERLGPQLAELGLSVDAQIEAICATLIEAWRPPPDGVVFMTGSEKALSLAGFIETLFVELDRPCEERTAQMALDFADRRGRAFDPEKAVLAHGDAHAWNTLAVLGDGPRHYKFVDPDGVFIEPAYDLAIPMREWAAELLAGDPVALGHRRCRQLGALTGIATEPIWQWGFVERVSTGLLCRKIGMNDEARDMLAVADAWSRAGPP